MKKPGWIYLRSGKDVVYFHRTRGRVDYIQTGPFFGRWTATDANGNLLKDAHNRTAYFTASKLAKRALKPQEGTPT